MIIIPVPSLVTAHFVYRMPDHLELMQELIWSFEDDVPTIPRLRRFLDIWEKESEAPLVHVTVAYQGLVTPLEVDYAKRNRHRSH
jgi:uncharacterized protein Usg